MLSYENWAMSWGLSKSFAMTPRSKRALSTLLCSFGTVVVVTAAMQPSAQQATGGRSHSSSRIWQAVATGAEPRSRKIAQDDLNRQRVQLCNIESRSGTLLSAESEAQLCISAVIPEEFRTAYPKLWTWIQKTLAFYEGNARPVASMHFARLPLYFDHSLLETVKFIAIDRPPMPPLTAMGLSRYAAFEQGNFDGITYLDRYFIKRTVVTEEGLHFHELIHTSFSGVYSERKGFLQPMQKA